MWLQIWSRRGYSALFCWLGRITNSLCSKINLLILVPQPSWMAKLTARDWLLVKNQGNKKVKVIFDFVSPDSTVYMVMGWGRGWGGGGNLLTYYTNHKVLLSGMRAYLEKETAVYSSIFGWRIQWTEELGRLQSMGSQRIRHSWVTNTHKHWRNQLM